MSRKKNKSKSNIGLLAPEVVDRIVQNVRANPKYICEVEFLSVLDVDISVEDFYNWRNDLDLTVLPEKLHTLRISTICTPPTFPFFLS